MCSNLLFMRHVLKSIMHANRTEKDSEGQSSLEDSNRGIFPAVEGHCLEYNRIETTR